MNMIKPEFSNALATPPPADFLPQLIKGDFQLTVGTFVPSVFDTQLSASREIFASSESVTLLNAANENQKVISRIARKAEVGTSPLYEATAQAKIWASALATRIPSEVRKRIFHQIDRLHDPDDWLEGDHPLQLNSFKSFWRALLIKTVDDKPSLALTPRGHLSALWLVPDGKLNIEFLAEDSARFLLTRTIDDKVERIAGLAPITRLRKLLPV